LVVGATAGLLAGSIGDLHVAGVDAEFVDEVAATLKPGKCAVIADISEEWITPVDTRMEALGGTVFRKARNVAEDDERARDVAALRAEIDQLKAEQARARGERKAKLQAKIDKANARLQAKLDQAKQRSEQIKSETDAKVQALQKKAEKNQGEIKATFDARVKQIRGDYEQSQTKLKHLLAGHLKEAAARLEK
jgi:transposase